MFIAQRQVPPVLKSIFIFRTLTPNLYSPTLFGPLFYSKGLEGQTSSSRLRALLQQMLWLILYSSLAVANVLVDFYIFKNCVFKQAYEQQNHSGHIAFCRV